MKFEVTNIQCVTDSRYYTKLVAGIRHVLISVTDPDTNYNICDSKYRDDLLRLKFWDIDKSINHNHRVYKPMDNQDARSILTFVERNINHVEYIIVNCMAGISRSAGIACGLSNIINGYDLDLVRKYPLYNKHCYNMIIEEFYNNDYPNIQKYYDNKKINFIDDILDSE